MSNIRSLEAIPRQAYQVLELAEELFGDQLTAIYLYGSSILGGLHPDGGLDILIITGEYTAKDMRKELTRRLAAISGEAGNTGRRTLEVTVVNLNDIADDPETVILLWQARGDSVPLKGPEAAALIPELPAEQIRKAIACFLPELTANVKGNERNVLLTLARMWFTAATGQICTKDTAAAWVLPKLPYHLAPLMTTARKAYLGECKDCWDTVKKETDMLIAFMKNAVEILLSD